MKRFLQIFAVVANLVLVDGVAKELAAGYLKGAAAISVIPNVFDLAYVENRGCAWGMFQGQVWPLAAFGLVALAFLVWQRKSVFGQGAVWVPAVLYAGIVGNVVDRLFRGYVIDMFDFHWYAHHFPCFNVADSCICIAVGLMLIQSWFGKRHPVDAESLPRQNEDDDLFLRRGKDSASTGTRDAASTGEQP